ncbi:MAG TPA: CBS domain-containing protein [Candidatus Limnocylindria bacterium]|nr:CBS domain-containing protein [Candidatus Limnocylindria bacterium]
MTARTVRDAMTKATINVHADAPLSEAASLLDTYHVSGLPVVDRDGDLVGVLSQTDLLRARVIDHLWNVLPGLAVRHLMTAPAVTATEKMPLDEAASLMEERQIHRLVVVSDDGRTPIGVLSVSDLIHEMARR